MPSEEYYTTAELAAMNTEELNAAKAKGFRKTSTENAIELNAMSVDTPSPPAPAQDPYDWSAPTEEEFTVPSGRKCLLKSADVKELAAAGILDRVTRLQGLANELVEMAEGKPPTNPSTDFGKSISELEVVLDKLLPLVVIKPRLYPVPKDVERTKGLVYVDSVPFTDKVAIANKTLGALAKFDNFRK